MTPLEGEEIRWGCPQLLVAWKHLVDIGHGQHVQIESHGYVVLSCGDLVVLENALEEGSPRIGWHVLERLHVEAWSFETLDAGEQQHVAGVSPGTAEVFIPEI